LLLRSALPLLSLLVRLILKVLFDLLKLVQGSWKKSDEYVLLPIFNQFEADIADNVNLVSRKDLFSCHTGNLLDGYAKIMLFVLRTCANVRNL